MAIPAFSTSTSGSLRLLSGGSCLLGVGSGLHLRPGVTIVVQSVRGKSSEGSTNQRYSRIAAGTTWVRMDLTFRLADKLCWCSESTDTSKGPSSLRYLAGMDFLQ
jgi:hypothetical protein